MEVLEACPVCDSKKIETEFKIKDYSISKEEFTLSSCRNCGFLFTNPRPEAAAISRYYESPDYISHSNSKKGVFNKVYQLIRGLSIKKKIQLLERLSGNDKTLLDIGCGTGEFLIGCATQGWKTAGIEPNDKARAFAVNEYHLNAKDEASLKDIPNSSFNVITLWHVLEHVHTLKPRVEEISRILKQNGIAVIAVPNHASLDANHYQQQWAAYDVPRHLYHFSEKTIKYLFNHYNFEWVESLPMKYDSFYVSILSEKYKNSRFQYIKAFYNGLLSNLKAGKNPEKYSSVIYIFKKK